MAGDPRVLGRLEEMLEAEKTPEEVCRNCPDLLAEVRERWRDFCVIDAAVVELLSRPLTLVWASEAGSLDIANKPQMSHTCPANRLARRRAMDTD